MQRRRGLFTTKHGSQNHPQERPTSHTSRGERMPITDVQWIPRHVHLSTTQIYVGLPRHIHTRSCVEDIAPHN